MRIRKRWVPTADLQSPISPLRHPFLLLSTKSSISSQQDDALIIIDGEEDNKHAAEKNSTILATNRRNYCKRNAASLSHQEGGHWLEEDKIFPLKKRRLLLNLDNAQISTAAKMESEMKNLNAGMSRKCTNMIWDDHVLKKDDDFECDAKEIRKVQNMMNSTRTRCRRSNGRGWRCSQSSFAGFSLCEHHWDMYKSRGTKERKKKKKFIPPKLAASKDDALIIIDGEEEDKAAVKRNSAIAATKKFCNPIADSSIYASLFHQKGAMKKRRVLNLDSTTTILQRELMNVNATTKSSNMTWVNHVLYKNEDFGWVADVMNNTPAAKKIRMAENMINSSTITRCTRTNGKGWRCSEPSFAGYSVCEHHWGLSKNRRRKESKNNKDSSSFPGKFAASEVPIALSSLQGEQKNIANARTRRKCRNKIWPDHVLNWDDDFEWISEVINSTPAAKKITVADNMSNNRY